MSAGTGATCKEEIMRKIALAVAMCGTTLASGLSTVAYADTIPEPVAQAPDSTTLAEMQSQCEILAQPYDTGNGDIVTVDVVPGTATKISGPTEVSGTRDILEDTIHYAGSYVPATLEIRGDPFRIGGSVNMFGDQWSTAGYWTDSTYNYTADFTSTFSHAFQCQVKRAVYHPAVDIEHRAVGVYVFNDDGTGNDEDAVRANCQQYTDNGQPWWGEPYRPSADNPRCRFEGTPATTEHQNESWDTPVPIALLAGVPVEQEQTDTLTAFEDHGGPVQVTGEYHVGQVVICISPSKPTPGGTWRQQNGYTGNKCTTDWFKVAPYGAGTESSNGTYISVPNYSL